MTPRHNVPRRSSPFPAAETDGEARKGETATKGRFPLPATVACLASLPLRGAELDTRRLGLADGTEVGLDKPDKFRYFCRYHRFMEGTVEVVE